jgi:hypothetical protein
MDNSNSPENPSSTRPTLKLKVGARKPAPKPEASVAPAPRPPSKSSQKPGAHWSDEYKQRMQADMDALISR